MQTFLSELATHLYDRYGDDLSALTLVFPSRRARLFFCDALSRVATRPLWQPKFVTLDELMERMAEVKRTDRIKLITELYKVYARHHKETFDSFYFWGEMLLADFDQIDKYLIDAKMLFTNISDLHAMEDDFSYLTAEQREIIAQFWRNFAQDSSFSQEKEHFLKIWHSLWAIYTEYRTELTSKGLGYEGMIHRRATEVISGNTIPSELADDPTHYIVAGFNALTMCEKRLFTWIEKGARADFFWDYDTYYTDNPNQEAGLFLRENIRSFPQQDILGMSDRFTQPKEVVVVSSPSDSLQCKYVYTFLQNLIDQGLDPGKETAIVLTDESLLLPVLYSIPEQVKSVNVTMGFPLRQTTAYSFVERLMELQSRVRLHGASVRFYHSDVVGILSHPYILEQQAIQANDIVQGIRRGQIVYVSTDRLQTDGLIRRIFTPVQGWQSLAVYLREVLSLVGAADLPPSVAKEETARRREFFTVIMDTISQVENSLVDSSLEVTTPIFSSLLRKILQGTRVPYQGEPLAGVQVMGILETRNLDFEHVLLLSVNDDTFPGNRAVTSSFVPHNLRLAYGLPTPQHHEGVYAYYFYRLAQRASILHLAYCSRSDDKRTGEPSRYIYQLDYESPHRIDKRSIPLTVNLSHQDPITQSKEGVVAQRLQDYLFRSDNPTPRKLSPTSLYNYVECPLKFYFKSVAGLKTQDEISEEIDLPMFGTILHRAMELLYAPLRGVGAPGGRIAALVGAAEVDQAVWTALSEEYLKDDAVTSENLSGNVILVRDIVRKYINSCVLPYDAAHGDFVLESLEEPVESTFTFVLDGQDRTLLFGGMADRIDLLQDGRLRVVDYKTGSVPDPFLDIASLFAADRKLRRPATFQTLLYSLMLSNMKHTDVQPALYYVREMNRPDFSPLLQNGTQPVHSFSDYRASFELMLRALFAQIFDLTQPFQQCTDLTTCAYCDFKEICRR